MKFIYHLFGTIFFIVWTLIGLVLVAGGFAILQNKPWQNVAPLMGILNAAQGSGSGLLNGLSSAQFGGAQTMMNKMSQFGTVKGFYDSLKPAEQTCLRKQIGSQALDAILANPQYKPTPDMVLKGVQCLNSK